MRLFIAVIILISNLQSLTKADVTGLYSGNLIYENRPKLPVVSEFKINEEGDVVGKYRFIDETNYEGAFHEGKLKGTNLKVLWTDDFGKGWLEIKFDEKFETFTGEWGFIVDNLEKNKEGEWTGEKIY